MLSLIILLIAFLSIDTMSCINISKGAKAQAFKPTSKQLQQIRINLSEKCEGQRSYQGVLANKPGNQYNFRVQGPTPNEIRVAFAGDSVTQGCCGSDIKEIDATPIDRVLNDQSDGSSQGLKGYGFFLHELLRTHNQSTQYTFMNYGIMAGSITPGIKYQSFLQDCRAEQLNKSMPHLVILGFGGMDQLLRNFTEQKFIEDYTNFIRQVQSMPTKPMVMLMVPVFTCLSSALEKPNDFPFALRPECNEDQNMDLQRTIYHIANMTGIPDQHVVNAWRMLRLNPYEKAELNLKEDSFHPNLKGMAAIAQEFYMKISLSQQFLERQQQVLDGTDENYNKALQELLQ